MYNAQSKKESSNIIELSGYNHKGGRTTGATGAIAPRKFRAREHMVLLFWVKADFRSDFRALNSFLGENSPRPPQILCGYKRIRHLAT